MVIYLTGSNARRAPSHLVHVAPAANLGFAAPSEWLSPTGLPLTIPIMFKFGRAEVADNLGAFMIAHGFAAKTALILPAHAA